ncbi:MAG: filamentous hemagglutinin N-terminal domain-containing protein, partial [Gammaproteobacteria bacterium]|nr:filamentous hemagglutinin N-terminal domain-containing protein [Gammaproteobacteria bacterium]
MNKLNKKSSLYDRCNLPRTALYVFVAAASGLLASAATLAGPEGGVVTGGEGSIARAGTTTNVQQLTERMSVQWQSFDLGRTETVNFLQPDSSSLVLNHIMQNGPSQIDGRINANGHVLMINPRGVIFGESSVINVGALTASTLWMKRDDFLNGDLVLRALDDTKGVVVNSGLINAASGGVTLLAESVSNEGLITAELGYVNLASGREAYLTFDEEGFLGVKVTEDVVDNLLGASSSVENSGEISATGGKVILQANVSSGLFDSAVNNSGIIEATGFNDGSGGTVHLLGDTVAVTEGARVSVDGFGGGGEILVGGDYQGANPAVDNSRFTTVAQNTVLSANATSSGDGGKVIIWADHTTRFEGDIEARGGVTGGDGGFAEVSGKEFLQISGHADLSAPNGQFGTLLLDPGTVTVQDGDDSVPDAPPDRNVINDGWINLQLDSGALVVTTTEASGGPEDINFNAGVVIEIENGDLTFIAGEDIQLGDATFTGVGTGNLFFNFGQTAGGVLNLDTATFTTVTTSITGGANSDTIVGASAYEVTAAGVGTADGSAFSFIENLTGTANADTFTLTAGSIVNLDGLEDNDIFNIIAATFTSIDGGAGPNDVVNFAAVVDLDVVATPISNVEVVNANAVGGDTLRGATAYLFKTATGVEANGDTATQYNGFEALVGTAVDDLFDLAGFAFTGSMDGLSQTAIGDTVAGSAAYEVTGAGVGMAGLSSFSGIENLTGTANADTFTLTAGSIVNLAGLGDDDI